MKISLDALEILDAIDTRGSYAAAAQALFRVPSALTHAVQKLEDELGVELFEKSGRRAVLTPAGRTLLEDGRQLLRAAGELERRVKRVATGWETDLSIAMDVVIPAERLNPLLQRFYAEAGGTRLRLSYEVLGGCWDALTTGRADLVIVLRDGRIQLYNPASSVVSDISIEAFDQKGNHIAPFEEAMSGLSGKLVYRGVLRSATVYENERFRRMTNRIGDVDDAFETVLSTLAQVGSRIKRLELTTSQNDSVQVNLQEMQTKNDYVDMAEVLTKLKEQENVLKAALSTGSRTLAPSLFDYLQ